MGEWLRGILGDGANAKASVDFWEGVLQSLWDVSDVLNGKGSGDDGEGEGKKELSIKKKMKSKHKSIISKGRRLDVVVHVDVE